MDLWARFDSQFTVKRDGRIVDKESMDTVGTVSSIGGTKVFIAEVQGHSVAEVGKKIAARKALHKAGLF